MTIRSNIRPALRTACVGGALALLLAACGEPATDAGDPAAVPPADQQGQAMPPAEQQQGEVVAPAEDQQSMVTGDELGDAQDTTQQ